jgi:1,4-dihydroxy-6-naphthoate synthase
VTEPVRLTVGLSTCPNDTFLFHGLLSGAVPTPGLELAFELLDIEELNLGLLGGRFDVAKGSFALALERAEELMVLPVGSALGRGNGPLLLARAEDLLPGPGVRVLAPGAHTTANLLLHLFHGPSLREAELEQVVFSAIQPALQAGMADLGACIHEGRFTWESQGLALIEDLGARWEAETGAMLPLGGLFARKRVEPRALDLLTAALRASLEYGYAHPEETLETMRAHAQEQSDAVLWSHVELYVTTQTRDLGPEGRAALGHLANRARAAGLLAEGAPGLAIHGPSRLLHLAPPEAATALTAGQPWHPPSLESEGFVHLSFEHQVAGSLAAHFTGQGPLALLELRPELLAAPEVLLELSRGGAPFPHLHRELRPEDLLRTFEVPATPEGGHRLPSEAALPAPS